MNQGLFIYLPIERHLDFFQVLATINKFSTHLDKSQSAIPRTYSKTVFSFVRKCQISKWPNHFVFLPEIYENLYCSIFWPVFGVVIV